MPDRPLKPSAMPGVVETVDDMGNPILVPLETAQRLGLTSTDVSGVPPQPQGAAAALQSVLGAPGAIQPSTQPGGAGASAPVAQGPTPVDIGTQVVRTDAAQQRFDHDRERGGLRAARAAEAGRANLFDPFDEGQVAALAEEFGADPAIVQYLLGDTDTAPPGFSGEGSAARIHAAERAFDTVQTAREAETERTSRPLIQSGIPQTTEELDPWVEHPPSTAPEAGQVAATLAENPNDPAALATLGRMARSGDPEQQQWAQSLIERRNLARPIREVEGTAAAPVSPGEEDGITLGGAGDRNLAGLEGIINAMEQMLVQGGGGGRGVSRLAQQLRALLPQIQGLSAEEKAAFEKYVADLEKSGADQQGTEQAIAGLQTQAAQEVEQQQIAFEKEVGRIQGEYDRRVSDMEQAVNDFSRMSVDPNRLFGSAPMAVQFSAALGVAVGEALKTATNIFLPGSNATNVALNLVNSAIDRSIDAQRANLAAGAQRVGMQNNLLAATQAKLGNAEMADQAARAAMLRRAELQVSAMIHTGLGQDAANKMTLLVDQLRQQRLAAELAAKQQAAAALQEQIAKAQRGRGNVWSRLQDIAKLRIELQKQLDSGEEPNLDGVEEPNGTMRFLRGFSMQPEGTQSSAIKNMAVAAQVIELVDELDSIRRQSGTWADFVERGRGAALIFELLSTIRGLGEGSLGAWDKGLQELTALSGFMENPAHATPDVLHKLEGVYRGLRSTAMRKMRSQPFMAPGRRYAGAGEGAGLPPGVSFTDTGSSRQASPGGQPRSRPRAEVGNTD